MAAKKNAPKGKRHPGGKVGQAGKDLVSPKTPPKKKSQAGTTLQKHQKKAH